MKAIIKLVIIAIFILNLPVTLESSNSSNLYAQDPVLLDNSWFVQGGNNSGTNTSWDNIMNTNSERRTEITFLNDKMVIQDCCGGVFEMDVNYIGNNEILFLNLTEIQNQNCSPISLYSVIKDVFSSMVNETIAFTIQNNPFESGIKDIVFNHPTNSSYIEFSNTPNELNDQAQSPYWGHEPPTHIWSLTQVQYQGETLELPYGAAPTIADIYEGTFTTSLCGEIFVAINSSWYLDIEDYIGPCFISCGILENTTASCEPVAGIDEGYLQTFKQNVFNFLNDNINQTMEYEFTFGSPPQNARKLIIQDFSQNKLIFHSNENFLSTVDTHFQSKVSIYPNPVKDWLTIETIDCTNCTIKVYNLNGKLLYSERLNGLQERIEVSHLSNGVYFLVVENERGINQTEKFVKK